MRWCNVSQVVNQFFLLEGIASSYPSSYTTFRWLPTYYCVKMITSINYSRLIHSKNNISLISILKYISQYKTEIVKVNSFLRDKYYQISPKKNITKKIESICLLVAVNHRLPPWVVSLQLIVILIATNWKMNVILNTCIVFLLTTDRIHFHSNRNLK